MKRKSLYRRIPTQFALLLSPLLMAWPCGSARAQTYSEWINGGNSLFSNTSNWSSGNVTNYGQLEFKGNGAAAVDNDLGGPLSQWRLYFAGAQSYTIGSSTASAINLFDFGGAFSWVLSDSSVTQTFGATQAINFAATSGDTFAQISARSTGDLVFDGNIGITGSQVSQLRLAGSSTGKVVLGGNISGTAKQVIFGLSETGTDVTTSNIVLKGTNTFDGGAYLVAGTTSVESGNLTSAGTVFLGQTAGTNPATLNLTDLDGGLNIARQLDVRAGSTGALTLGATNTSGTNTWSGNVNLANSVVFNSANAGGTLAVSGGITSSTAGVKLLTVRGAGTTTLSGALTSGLGTLNLNKLDAGVLNIGNSATFSGNGVNATPGATPVPVVLWNGTTNQTAGTIGVTGEFVVGGVVANGGAGNNVNYNLSGSSILNVSTWFSIGRGNGIGGVTSAVTLNNTAAINTVNLAMGFNGGSTLNAPKSSLTLNDSSTVTVSGNPINVGEAQGAIATVTLNNSSVLTQTSAGGAIRLGGANGAVGNVVVNGGTGNFYRDLILGYGGTGTGNLVINSGTVNVASTTERWLIIGGAGSGATGTITMDGGILNLNTNTDIRFTTNAAATGTNVINLNGGAITGWAGHATGGTSGGSVVDMNRSATGAVVNTLNLNGGTLTIGQILNGVTGGTATVNFNGGTLKAAAASTAFFNITGAAHTANVKSGGAIVDSNGYAITIAEPLLADTVSLGGGLTKNGLGVLTLSGVSTFTGNTAVNAGGLTLSAGGGAGSVRGVVNVAAGATLTGGAVDGLGYTSGQQVSTVNLNGDATNTATFNNAVNGNNGYRTNFNLTGGTVLSSGGGSVNFTSGFGIASLASSVTSAWSAPIIIRDTAVLPVSTALGSTSSGVDLHISSVISQQFAASGLAKSGAGTLNLSAINTFTGPVDIDAGTLEISGSGQLGSGNFASTITNDGALEFSTSANQTLGGVISGTGSLKQSGAGTLTLSGANTYAGDTSITGGTLLLGASHTLPDGSALSLSTGATLDVNNNTDTAGIFSVLDDAVINMGTGAGSQITFADVDTWTGVLSIWNYDGAAWTAGVDKLLFNTTTNVNLAKVQFYSDNGLNLIGTVGGTLLSGELVPVPEPSSVLAALALLGVLGYRERRSLLHFRK